MSDETEPYAFGHQEIDAGHLSAAQIQHITDVSAREGIRFEIATVPTAKVYRKQFHFEADPPFGLVEEKGFLGKLARDPLLPNKLFADE